MEQTLLRAGESVPKAVAATLSFLRSKGIWFRVSRNQHAESCRDAAQKRYRLGHTGIPLWDEFKSFLGTYADGAGKTQVVAVHCRGDRQLNLEAIQKAVGADCPIERTGEQKLQALGMDYGLVNPVRAYTLDGFVLRAPILQLFDEELFVPIGLPGTMMTNAGDYTWAIEFRPSDLFAAIPYSRRGQYIEPGSADGNRPKAPPRIGILTGNAPESGLLLWSLMNDAIRDLMGEDCLGDISMPEVHLVSLPEMGLSMELEDRHVEVWAAMDGAIRNLLDEDIDVLAIADNTTQYFKDRIQDLCEESGSEFLFLPALVEDWLSGRGVDKAAIIGIPYVSDPGPWSAYHRHFSRVQLVSPTPRARSLIEQVAYQVKQEGPNESALNRLRDVIKQEIAEENVILALTELSILLSYQRKVGRGIKTLFDPMQIYAQALAEIVVYGVARLAC